MFFFSKDNASVAVCTNILGDTSLKHYYNSNINYKYSNILDPMRPSLGLSNLNLITNQGNLIASFTRDNYNQNQNYFNLRNGAAPYIIVAYGTGLFKKKIFKYYIYNRKHMYSSCEMINLGTVSYHGRNKQVSCQPVIFISNKAQVLKKHNMLTYFLIILLIK